eukprot:gene8378-17280_t
MSSSQISCSAYLILVGSLGIFIIINTGITAHTLDYFDPPYLIAYTYVEAGFTVILTLLQSRLRRHEVIMKERGIEDGEDKADLMDTLNDIEGACGVSLEILNDLLAYEKLEAGIMTLDKTNVNAW